MRNVDKCKDELIRMANDHSYVYVSDEIEGCEGDEQFIKFLRNEASSGFIEWLYKEYTFKLSTLEYELLRHFYRDGYRYIARDRSNALYLYKDSPFKELDIWMGTSENLDYKHLNDFENEFSSVRWEDTQPTPIQEILENCEVADDD